MQDLSGVVLFVSMMVVAAMIFMRSVLRTKSSIRWVKGISFQGKKTEEEVFEYVKRINHPSVESVAYNTEGNIVVNTPKFNFPVEVSENKEGNTTIGFIVHWNKVGRYKRKKVAFLLDELYLFLSYIVEGKDLAGAMKVYEKNLKFSKILFVAECVMFVAFGIFALFTI